MSDDFLEPDEAALDADDELLAGSDVEDDDESGPDGPEHLGLTPPD